MQPLTPSGVRLLALMSLVGLVVVVAIVLNLLGVT